MQYTNTYVLYVWVYGTRHRHAKYLQSYKTAACLFAPVYILDIDWKIAADIAMSYAI